MLGIDHKIDQYTTCYNDYYPLVLGTIYTKVSNHDIACDLAQEVFIRLYEKFDEVEKPRKWLLGTVRFVLLEFYKEKKDIDVDVDVMMNDVNLSFVNAFKDTRIMIEEALENMENFRDRKERLLFEHIAVHNLSYREAGQQLGFTMKQARYRYGLIVERLVDYFKERGIESLEDLL